MEPSTLRVALVDTGNLVKDILVLKEFWEMTGGKMSGHSRKRGKRTYSIRERSKVQILSRRIG